MNQINSVILEGTAENLKSNGNFAEFQVSTKRFYGNAEETSVFNCEVWGILKDLLSSKFKGKSKVSLRIVGRLIQKRWKDEAGKCHSKIAVICEHIDFK